LFRHAFIAFSSDSRYTEKVMSNKALQEILSEHFQKKGELPILRDTVAPLLQAVEAEDTNASDIARIILRDQAYTTKVLKMANSVYYNPMDAEITTISRAVVLLGLEKIRTITLKLAFVNMFQKHHPGIDLNRLVAGSLISATLAREIAGRLKHPSSEKIFIHALLYNLGAIAVAYYMPNEFIRIEEIIRDEGLPPGEAQARVIGFSFNDIAVGLATKWEFPEGVVETFIEANRISPDSAASPKEQLWICARLSNEIASNLSNPLGTSGKLLQILKNLDSSLGIKPEKALQLIETSYKNIKGIVVPFDLKSAEFKPSTLHGYQDKTIRDRLLKKIHELFSNEDLPSESRPETRPPIEEACSMDALKISLLREISMLLSEGDDISLLFDTVLESIHRGAGFDRAFLAILTADRTRITGRYSIGRDALELFKHIDIANQPEENIFAKTLSSKEALFVENTESNEVSRLIPESVKAALGAGSFVVSPIYSAKDSIGFIYADKAPSGQIISREDYQSFLHFALQANIGFEKISLASPVQISLSL